MLNRCSTGSWNQKDKQWRREDQAIRGQIHPRNLAPRMGAQPGQGTKEGQIMAHGVNFKDVNNTCPKDPFLLLQTIVRMYESNIK